LLFAVRSEIDFVVFGHLWHQGRFIELARAPLACLENWEQGLDNFDLRLIQGLALLYLPVKP
jgi:hypothetical protein